MSSRGWCSWAVQTLGQSIVIENKGGARRHDRRSQVAKAEPDGYTLLFHSSTHVIARRSTPPGPIDTANDFALWSGRQVPERAGGVAVKGLQGLKTLSPGQTAPGGFTYASAGVGSTTASDR